MTRTTFLFLALLIGSCIVTVNARHQTRTLITEKEVLVEKTNSLNERIRRLQLENARLAAKDTGALPEETSTTEAEPASKAAVAKSTAPHKEEPAKPAVKTDDPIAELARADALKTSHSKSVSAR